jgi:hypothetical protein
MDSRVVQPDSCRLPLSAGDWILVKKRLSAGENKRMVQRGSVDLVEAGTAKILAYLLDWSVTDPAGKPIVIRDEPDSVKEAAIDSIDPDSYGEILRAIEAHETAMRTERDAQKKIPAGGTTS